MSYNDRWYYCYVCRTKHDEDTEYFLEFKYENYGNDEESIGYFYMLCEHCNDKIKNYVELLKEAKTQEGMWLEKMWDRNFKYGD